MMAGAVLSLQRKRFLVSHTLPASTHQYLIMAQKNGTAIMQYDIRFGSDKLNPGNVPADAS
jgi:hypothetical protein